MSYNYISLQIKSDPTAPTLSNHVIYRSSPFNVLEGKVNTHIFFYLTPNWQIKVYTQYTCQCVYGKAQLIFVLALIPQL